MSANPFDIRTVLLAKHAQHVVLIHFPIALFTAAVAFDFLAQWTKDRTMSEDRRLTGSARHGIPPARYSVERHHFRGQVWELVD